MIIPSRISAKRRYVASNLWLFHVMVAGTLLAGVANGRAANILANPSMEGGLDTAWTCYGRTGQEGWYSYALATTPDPTVTGNNSFKVYAAWNGDPNYGGTYQDVACLATSQFTADGWFRTKSSDKIVGSYGAGITPDSGNTAWIEVTFRDGANTVLALYKSAVFDGAWDPDVWFAMPVTNQCDPATALPTNSVTTLVAPAGTVKARYQIVLKQSAWVGAGALWVDDMVLNQVSGPTAPTISSISPGAILLANAANGISFTASSSSGTTIPSEGIKVQLNGNDISSGLVINGTDSIKNVSYPGLQTNQSYTVVVQVTDALGLLATTTFSFDTWSPLFLWEGEDYDFNGGQYINAPILSSGAQPNSYFDQVAMEDVDMNETSNDGDRLYRTLDLMATPTSGDVARKKYQDAQAGNPLINDYKIGWFYTGEWVNYTRDFVPGTYNVYARLAGGAGAATVTLSKVLAGWGSTEQTLTNLGTFSFVGTGWSTFQYVPLKDPNGNLVPLTLSGTNTLRVTTGGGGDLNFLMLVVADTNRPIISAIYPDGSTLLQKTNTFRFRVESAAAPINNTSIGLLLNGVDVAADLVISGTPNDKTVTYTGLLPNVLNYTAIISVTNANGIAANTTVHFDTFNPELYSWEAEDYDYGGGQFIDNPQTNAYYGLSGLQDVDFHELFVNTPQVAYRTSDPMGTDETGDVPRLRYTGTNDFNIGWFTAGEWVNFTRTFPAGKYLVYGRFSRGTGTNAAPLLSRVTSGVGTTTQTTVDLGFFSVDSHGWGSYNWVQLKNAQGEPVTLQLDGNATTLRLTSAGPEANTEVNANFLMLAPVANPVSISARLEGNNIVLSFLTESGFSYQIQYKQNVDDANWNNLGSPILGTGSLQTFSETATTGKRFYRLQVR